jgi:hypothetical protein
LSYFNRASEQIPLCGFDQINYWKEKSKVSTRRWQVSHVLSLFENTTSDDKIRHVNDAWYYAQESMRRAKSVKATDLYSDIEFQIGLTVARARELGLYLDD